MKHCFAFLLFTLVFTAVSIPPPPGIFDIPGSEHLAWTESYRDAAERGVDQPNSIYGSRNPIVAALGDDQMNVLILLVDFSDKEAQTPATYFDSMGFAQDTFSLASYYSVVSFGQIDIVTVDWPGTTLWTRAPETYDYYANNNYGWGSYPQNSQGLVETVCTMIDPVVDFSQYDNDGDGFVDGVNLMYAGKFDGTPQMIWPHAWSLYPPLSLDGVQVYKFSVQNEYNTNPGDKSASVFCHEFGHVLGLPDLYDLGYDSQGIGNWGMMSYGVYNGGGWSPAEFCPYCRNELGITEFVDVTEPGMYQVPAIELSNVAYRIWTEGAPGYQYFILENRRQIGWDEALPSQGVLIWHVDKYQSNNNYQWYPGHTEDGHYRVALEQADGQWHLEKNMGGGDVGDPYPGSSGNSEFTYWTIPDSRTYTGVDTQVYVSSIPVSADTVEVYISTSYTGIEEENKNSESFMTVAGNTIFVNHTGGMADIAIFDITGRRLETLYTGYLQSGEHRYNWNTNNVPSGVFFAGYRWETGWGSAKLLCL
ncbi:MAG: M6 family metalloprotease domain-containing protein [Candidatus Sabulitectum sp.]|nr:M6 family metalloprotease domain-containing protein [Candidatus Sabulitectum sp.]